MKIIILTSAGKNWIGKFSPQDGNLHGKKIIHFLLNIEEVIPRDPVNELPMKPGTDKEIQQWILNQPEMSKWLAEKKKWIREIIEKYSDDKNVIICFNGRCKGGFQRSPAIIQYLADWLKTDLNTEYKIVVNHLTLDLAYQVKKILNK